MSDNDAGVEASDLEGARAELEAWRTDPSKGMRIPDSVWDKAVRASRRHGIHTVSRYLGISYTDLKGHVHGAPGRRRPGGGGAVAFVEVTAEPSAADTACLIEISKGSGTRLRISLKSSCAVDWCRIKEAFLGA